MVIKSLPVCERCATDVYDSSGIVDQAGLGPKVPFWADLAKVQFFAVEFW